MDEENQRTVQEHSARGSPDMRHTHRPDLKYSRESLSQRRNQSSQLRDTYLQALYQNRRLVKEGSLLLFLNACGHHLPDVFALADCEAFRLGTTSLGNLSAFLNEHVMVLRGQITIEIYGQLIATEFATEKLHGSVWQFTTTKLGVECSIQFHELHPLGKTPFKTVRRHVHSLNRYRTYRWTGDMFELA